MTGLETFAISVSLSFVVSLVVALTMRHARARWWVQVEFAPGNWSGVFGPWSRKSAEKWAAKVVHPGERAIVIYRDERRPTWQDVRA